jgi:hypothetical protein
MGRTAGGLDGNGRPSALSLSVGADGGFRGPVRAPG